MLAIGIDELCLLAAEAKEYVVAILAPLPLDGVIGMEAAAFFLAGEWLEGFRVAEDGLQLPSVGWFHGEGLLVKRKFVQVHRGLVFAFFGQQLGLESLVWQALEEEHLVGSGDDSG